MAIATVFGGADPEGGELAANSGVEWGLWDSSPPLTSTSNCGNHGEGPGRGECLDCHLMHDCSRSVGRPFCPCRRQR